MIILTEDAPKRYQREGFNVTAPNMTLYRYTPTVWLKPRREKSDE